MDALNWAGLSEDTFNESLAACTSEQERQQLIVDTLNDLYGKSADKYRENNASIIAAREANLAYQKSLAAIGGAMEPLNTQLTNLNAQLLSSLIPGIQQLCAAFQNLFAGDAGAEADVANAVLSIINAVFTQLQGILPKILTIIYAARHHSGSDHTCERLDFRTDSEPSHDRAGGNAACFRLDEQPVHLSAANHYLCP